ncbi:MAG: hypothetical protein AAFO94_02795 [Bacteroidota bacterium]
MKASILLTLLTLLTFGAFAQIDYPEAFVEKLDAGQLLFIEPVEGKYKDIANFRNEYWNFDMSIKSKKEKVELRYAILTDTSYNGFNIPQIRMLQMLSNVATNDQIPVVAVHSIPQSEIEHDYSADWAALAYFTPKPTLSHRDQCKVLVLHRDDVATVFVFMFFDKPTDELEDMMHSIRFREIEEDF